MSLFKKIINKTKCLYYKRWFSKHGLEFNKINTIGLPIIKNEGRIIIDGILTMVNTPFEGTLGINRKSKFNVYKNAVLHFKGSVSMSNAVLVATRKITIGNNVMIGGGVTIVDSDFHSMDSSYWGTIDDEKMMKSVPVEIGDNVFIGMNSIILKGVNIGEGAIIGAGSVVSRNIPSGEIWGGNPATFIRVNDKYKNKT